MQEIRVYTTPTCGYCTAAKRLLSQKGYPYVEVDLARDPALRQQLSAANGGYRTVPMIFIGTTFIGGYTDLAQLDEEDKLDAMVKSA